MDRGGSKVLDAGNIRSSIKYMRAAMARSGQVFVYRVVYGFVQALNAINVILRSSTGEKA